jgi:hypothetical protein
MIRMISVCAALLCAVLPAQDKKPAEQAQTPAVVQKPALYPDNLCIVSDEPLEADAVTVTVEGETFKACCKKCAAKVEKDHAKYSAKLAEKQKAAQLANYPLKTCAVSKEELGSMGEPVQLMLEGTLVQLCCKSCTKKAMAKPAEMAQKVKDAAYAAQQKTANTTCPVGGEKLEDKVVEVMFGTKLVRFCCEKCAAKFEQEPAKYQDKLAPAAEQPKADEKKDEKKSGGK